jgi:glycosyltransferase involved in cell wall biosynthesis
MMNTSSCYVSVILPCRNEAKGISSCLASIVASDFPKEQLELLVVDGRSDDGTREIVNEFSHRHQWIKLLDNEHRITPTGLNIGIQSAKGQIVVRMDAHTVYPTNYISGLVSWLIRSKADNVGGICVTRPANNSPKAQAIAFALSHPLGVGNAYFRIGVTEPKWVDTVPFGCYRKDVFERIGLYNEALVRNQDDELNHRLIKQGGRILLVPEITSFYTARESLRKLWVMFYQYGYFKPLAVRTIGAVMTVRQIVPFVFVMSLMLTGSLAVWSHMMGGLFGAIIIIYAILDLSISLRAGFEKSVYCGLWSVVVFPIIHISYGTGYFKGVLDFFILQKRKIPDALAVPLSR